MVGTKGGTATFWAAHFADLGRIARANGYVHDPNLDELPEEEPSQKARGYRPPITKENGHRPNSRRNVHHIRVQHRTGGGQGRNIEQFYAALPHWVIESLGLRPREWLRIHVIEGRVVLEPLGMERPRSSWRSGSSEPSGRPLRVFK